MTLSSHEQSRRFTFQGPAFVFYDADEETENEDEDLNQLVLLARTGNDSRNVLPSWLWRPTSGIYLGPCNNLIENRSCKLEPTHNGGTDGVPDGYNIEDETISVEGDILFNDCQEVIRPFRFPGTVTSTKFTQGGKPTATLRSLTVIRFNKMKRVQQYLEVHHYQRGAFQPASQRLNAREEWTIPLRYLPAKRIKPDLCDYPEGEQTMIGYFVRVLVDGTNELVNPTLYE